MQYTLYIDFEYNSSNQRYLNLVCASFDVYKKGDCVHSDDVWLYGDRTRFAEVLKDLEKKFSPIRIVCWSANAEGRSFIAGGVDPRDYKWIDLQAEYKMLLNHHNKFQYGEQIQKGKLVVTTRPVNKWAMTEEELKKLNFSKPESNLVAACFKLLNVRIDKEHKDDMRNIIIRNDAKEIQKNKKEILEYCRSDIKYLPQMMGEIFKFYKTIKDNPENRLELKMSEVYWRGRSVLNTAVIENNGYPIAADQARTFTKNVPKIMLDLIKDIDQQFDEGESPFSVDPEHYKEYDGAPRSLIMPSKRIKYWKEWISKNVDTKKWLKTGTKNKKTGKYGLSTSLDAFQRYFRVPSNRYENRNFAHQIVRYLKFNQNLNGFLPSKGKAKFVDFIGSDERVRGYLNSYGSQSARWQPKAVSFLFLKSAWMRSMCKPKPGRYVCGIDYSQQEFLILALLAQDPNMINAYETGDVYLHTAKLAGAVPKEGTKKSHPVERDIYKQVTLAINYLMSKHGLADALTQSLKRQVTEDEAQKFIDDFNKVYEKGHNFMQVSIIQTYLKQKFYKLKDGWVLFGDNPNFRSYGNFPMQGMGSCILRKAIDMAIDEGFQLVFPLHDALYFEGDVATMEKDITRFDELMQEAFAYYFDDPKQAKELIRTDINIWGPDLKDGTIEFQGKEVKSQEIYIDPRGEREFNLFKKYLVSQ